MRLTIIPATGGAARAVASRAQHRDPVFTAQQRGRRRACDRNHLTLAYLDGVLVGNATVRPVQDGAVTVIVLILPEHRRQGLGSEYLRAVLQGARVLAAERIDTVVTAANASGLAVRHGFVEADRYDVDGAAFIDLSRPTLPVG